MSKERNHTIRNRCFFLFLPDLFDNRALSVSAAIRNYETIVDLLLGAGADPTVKDMWGKTAADYARLQGHNALAAKLEAAARWQTERLLWLGESDEGSPLRLMIPDLLHMIAEIHAAGAS